MDVVRESVARTVPSINFAGATAFHSALDENLVASLTGAKTAQQAMADTAASWKQTFDKIGSEKMLEAIKTNKAAWPTVVDPIG
jgi:multiple sugar transport system substrate-binding protein